MIIFKSPSSFLRHSFPRHLRALGLDLVEPVHGAYLWEVVNGTRVGRGGGARRFAGRFIGMVKLSTVRVPMVVVVIMGGLVAGPVGRIVKVDHAVRSGVRAPAVPAGAVGVRGRDWAASGSLHSWGMEFRTCNCLQPLRGAGLWLRGAGQGRGGISPVNGVGRR